MALLAAEPHDDEAFAAHELEFIRHLFGRCADLRKQPRPTPVSDAFLSVFVNLIDVLEANAPEEARQCATQLQQVIGVVFPDLRPATRLTVTPLPPLSPRDTTDQAVMQPNELQWPNNGTDKPSRDN